jgi:hypothetical protein
MSVASSWSLLVYSLLPTTDRNFEHSAYSLDYPSLWHTPQISLRYFSSGAKAPCPSVSSSDVHVAFRCLESTDHAFDTDGTKITERGDGFDGSTDRNSQIQAVFRLPNDIQRRARTMVEDNLTKSRNTREPPDLHLEIPIPSQQTCAGTNQSIHGT